MYKLKQLFCQADGLDTSTFFGDQGKVDESVLPDASSEEALAMQPPPNDASDGKDPVEEGGDPPEAGKEGTTVPLGAVQEERAKRQQAQDRVSELETQNNTLLERMNQILLLQQQQQAAQQPKQEEQAEQVPDFIDDPVGHIEALKKQFARELAEVRAQATGLTQQQQAQQQHQQLVAMANAQEAQFRETQPDYDNALAHFQAIKLAEYTAFGLNELQRAQQIQRDTTVLVHTAMQSNRNPAEVIYTMAKALGYNPTQQQPPQQQQPLKQPPTSLSNIPASGRAPDERGKLTGKDIATMPQDEFDKLFESMRGDSVQRPAF